MSDIYLDADEDNIKKFWLSFVRWFREELPGKGILKDSYEGYDSWGGGTYYVEIDFDKEYKLYYGIHYSDVLDLETPKVDEMKLFIELAYEKWVSNRYDFTVKVNGQLEQFSMPYKLKNGRFIREGCKTSFQIGPIINYPMFERKIRYSEEMITSSKYLDKKCALDYIIDALQFIVSVQDADGERRKRILAAKCVNEDENSMVHKVVCEEIQEIMKFSNEFFDIRHNEYLNKGGQEREPLGDLAFIEYLYNRAYALLFLLRVKTDPSKLINYKRNRA